MVVRHVDIKNQSQHREVKLSEGMCHQDRYCLLDVGTSEVSRA